jgi:phosphoesterase RecJ-like protein
MADALYTAISTDTGCFRYANTTANTLAVASQCAKVSKNLFAINQALFDTNSLGRLRLQGWMVEHAIFLAEGKVAICALPKSVEKELHLTEDDLENISGFPRSIEGVKIAATIREDGNNRVKISVRAVPGYDAAAICQNFGGGGHKGAAGASMNCTMDEAVEAIKNVMPKR